VGDSAENKSDSIQKNFDSIRFTGSGIGTGSKGWAVARPKFLAVNKIVRKSCQKMFV